jgi:hypothetical protein
MAAIGLINFEVVLNGGDDATLEGTWNVAFDGFDQSSNLAYLEVVKLLADDTGVGDVNAGIDRAIRTLRANTIRANGSAFQQRSITAVVPTSDLNEDPSPLQPQDELRLVVELTPQVETERRESNLVTGRFA